MKRVALCLVGADAALHILEEFEDAAGARKRIRTARQGELEPGEYAIVAYLNKGITVEPPAPTERLRVNLGSTFITKAPRSAVSGEARKSRTRKPKAPAEGGA